MATIIQQQYNSNKRPNFQPVNSEQPTKGRIVMSMCVHVRVVSMSVGERERVIKVYMSFILPIKD